MAISKLSRRPKLETFQPVRLAASIGVCLATGFIGLLVTTPAINSWYRYLNQPVLAPPNWIFAPVWTILYILMGISLYLAWRRRARLTWFWLQLVLNANWSSVFFGLRSPKLALLNIIVLWLSIVLAIKDFRRKSVFAAWLLVPYLAWVTFATYLNWAIMRLN
ncbi:tryptophan-rich sensory protein [Candidatus Collierbacteria bacterium]|nr:tryptophan-rich sensory protein [Candidatus Collierbacteria bacterium]